MLLVSGRVSVPKPLSQIQRSTRWLLQGLSPRTSFGGFGLIGTPTFAATDDNTIGGTALGAGNTIAFNSDRGVKANAGTGNAILGNSIFSNTGLGIDLGGDGVTPNDAADADTGANNLQNFPVLTSAVSGSTIIQGTLNSTASSTQFRLEFFSNTSCDPSGNGEGETFLGFTDVTTDGSGNVSFAVTFTATVSTSQFITATATDSNNNTSEFSQCISVAGSSTTRLTPTPEAPGATFTVNSTDDADDGTCDATHCSLREAINTANNTSGTDTIAFNLTTTDSGYISTTASWRIQPTSTLPSITDPVIIDGYTQPGASPNNNSRIQGSNAVLKIEIDGTNTPPPVAAQINGLAIEAGNSTVRGLVINRFGIRNSESNYCGDGIYLSTNGGNVIEGNFIGTDVTGSVEIGNTCDGVGTGFASPNNIIGGSTAEARNVISGNGSNGVSIFGFLATGNLVQGNLIGTDVTGTIALGNTRGIWVSTAANTIGGITIAARNVISGSRFSRGIRIYGMEATGNKIQGNFIGTDVTGRRDLGNLIGGVAVTDGASNNPIGGAVNGAGNTIAFNGGDGISWKRERATPSWATPSFPTRAWGSTWVAMELRPTTQGTAMRAPTVCRTSQILYRLKLAAPGSRWHSIVPPTLSSG